MKRVVRRKFGVALFGVAFCAALAGGIPPAAAQMMCGQRTEIVNQLAAKFGETRRSVGLAEGRGVIEVYASEKTGSWTILLTNTEGTACLMAAGEAFQVEEAKVADSPA